MDLDSNVLIVDDRTGNEASFKAIVESAGFVAHCAAHSDEALNILRGSEINLVLLDTTTVGSDGYQICRQIRKLPNFANLPIVLITALNDREAVRHGIAAGANDFITRPVSDDDFRARIRTISDLQNSQGNIHPQPDPRHISVRDPTVEFQNAKNFIEYLNTRIDRDGDEGSLIVLSIGLDGFDVINNAWGLTGGDQLLKQVSRRLANCLDDDEILARMGARFLVLIRGDHKSDQKAADRAERMQAMLSHEPYKVNNQEIAMSACVGISLYPQDASDADTLIARAGSALTHALRQGPGQRKFFADRISADALNQLLAANRLRSFLDCNRLHLHYQPRLSLEEGHCTGLDAQLFHREQGFYQAVTDHELDFAYNGGLGKRLDEWALAHVTEQVERWLEEGKLPPVVSVCLSQALLQTGQLVPALVAIRQRLGDQSSLQLSFRERALHSVDFKTLLGTLIEVKQLGFGIAVDQVGSGALCIHQLVELPIDVLYLSADTIAELPDSRNASLVVKSIIGLAYGLGQITCARGVTTEAQRKFLWGWRCNEAQGTLLEKPLTAPALTKHWGTKVTANDAAGPMAAFARR